MKNKIYYATTDQVARAVQLVSFSTVSRYCKLGKLEFYRTPGGHRRIDLDYAMEFFYKTKSFPHTPFYDFYKFCRNKKLNNRNLKGK